MEADRAVVAKDSPDIVESLRSGRRLPNYVRSVLYKSGMECSDPVCEPELQQTPIFSFVATPRADTPLTAPELQAILDQDGKIDVAFDA